MPSSENSVFCTQLFQKSVLMDAPWKAARTQTVEERERCQWISKHLLGFIMSIIKRQNKLEN